MDSYSNIYICDGSNSRVRFITQFDGMITTVAGDNAGGFSGDGGPATNAELSSPDDVYLDGFNNLYISDYYNYRVREVTGLTTGIVSTKNTPTLSIFPNPSTGIFTISFVGMQNLVPSTIEIYNVLGEKVFSQFTIHHAPFTIDLSNQPSGIYFYRVLNTDGSLVGEGKVIIEK